MQMENQEQMFGNIVLVPYPFQGHLNPMLNLGSILHSKGFSITIAHTKFNSPDPSNHPNFTFLPITDDLSNTKASSLNFIAIIRAINHNLEVHLPKSLARMVRQEQDNYGIVCIIYDALLYKAESVASHLKIPSVIFETSSASLSLAFAALPRLQADGFIPLKESMANDMVPGLHPLRFKDLPIVNFPHFDDLLQLITTTADIRSSSAIIWNTTACLEQASLAKIHQHFQQVSCFAFGPFHKIVPTTSSSLLQENSNCITWLDEQAENSVIYVSIGSVASIDEKEMIEIAWGLANSEQPFLWVVRPGSVSNQDRISPLPHNLEEIVSKGRGYIVEWAPQKEVLAHAAVGGFWSHCGWNSTLESISEGVPMICRPCFGDQMANSRYVNNVWRVGITMENDKLDRVEVERAVRRLMVDKEGEELRQRAKHTKTQIENSIRPDGSSYKSLNDLVGFLVCL